MLRVFGVRDVAVLDGGFPAWAAHAAAQGRPDLIDAAPLRADAFLDRGALLAMAPSAAPAFPAALAPGAVKSLADMRAVVAAQCAQVLDARPAGRFTGAVPEPRAGLRGGHMPGARSVPFDAMLSGGRLKDPAALRAAFEAAGVDLAAPTVCSCGTGVTACVVGLGLEVAGGGPYAVYDGSWTEWGALEDTPVVTGD